MKIKLLYFIALFCFVSNAQIASIDHLEEQVLKNNDALHYEKSITLLCAFISDEKTTPFEKYTAYLLKAYTYKRLFNYEATIENLDLALSEGLKSNKKLLVKNTIKAQKAFCYFDQHEYEKAKTLMQELAASHYAELDVEDKSFIIMQEGYLLMLKEKYVEAEKKLDEALDITKNHNPRNLPNIYGKKIELYNKMKLYDKRDAAFRSGMQIAKEYKVIKYEMYLYEVLRNEYQKNNDYKSAFEVQKKYDSISFLYNASNNNGKIALLEQKLEHNKQKLAAENQWYIKIFLIILISILVALLIISVRLYTLGKERRKLLETENKRIHDEIERLTKQMDDKGNAAFDLTKYDLTERQKEIIDLIQKGKTNKEISNQLFISENTVKYHLKIIYDILDIEHRLELSR